MLKLDQKNTKKLKIGLLGGSFDPPHEGHLFISNDALRRFNLDYVWWVVAKQNTLKKRKADNFSSRVKLCKELLKRESKILVLDIEKQIKSENTIDLINFIRQRYNYDYFWIMGSDSFFTFNQWPKWQDILNLVKIIIYDRPGFLFKDKNKKLEPGLEKHRKSFKEFQICKLPAWALVKIPTPNISSTEIRLKYDS